MLEEWEKYFNKTIRHYMCLIDKTLLQSLQLAPFYFLRNFTDDEINKIATEYFTNYINNPSKINTIPGYLKSESGFKDGNIIHPFDFCILESLCWLIFDNYKQDRPGDIEVFFNGSPDNNLFGEDRGFAEYLNYVEVNSKEYSNFILFDIKSFSKTVSIFSIVGAIRNSYRNLNETLLQHLIHMILEIGNDCLPQFKVNSGCRFLSSVVAFDQIDSLFYKKLSGCNKLDNFKIIRNGDDCLVLFNASNIEKAHAAIQDIYSGILLKSGLTLNTNKTKVGKSVELDSVLYSDSTITKLTNKAYSAAFDLPVANSSLQKYLKARCNAGAWNRNCTYYASILTVLKSSKNKMHRDDFLLEIINEKDPNLAEYLNSFCINPKLTNYECEVDKCSLSIIVRCHNSSKYLHKCLDSLCSQIYKDCEIVFVDDASDDNSLQIATRFKQGYDFIEVLSINKQSRTYAREVALKFASGEYIAFCDADDFVSDEYIKTCLDSIDKNHESGLFIYGYKKLYSNASEEYLPNFSGLVGHKQIIDLINSPFEFGGCMGIFKKSFLAQRLHNMYALKSYEDFSFTYRCLVSSSKTVFINKSICFYNKQNDDSATSTTNVDIVDVCACCSYYADLINQKQISEEYVPVISNKVVGWLLFEMKRKNSVSPLRGDEFNQIYKSLSSIKAVCNLSQHGLRNHAVVNLIMHKKYNLAMSALALDDAIYKNTNNNLDQKTTHKSEEETYVKPIISIVIPAYNCQDTIADCISSITTKDNCDKYEIVVVQNASTDNTTNVLKELKAKPNLKVYNLPEANVSKARIYGISKASGHYVLFADADDTFANNTIDDILEILHTHPNLDMISFDYHRKTSHNNHVIKNNFTEGFYNASQIKQFIVQSIVFNMSDTLWSYCFKREFIADNYCTDTSITQGEDTATIFSALVKCQRLYILHKPLYNYNCNSDFLRISKYNIEHVLSYINQNCQSIDNITRQVRLLKNSFEAIYE